MNIGDEELMSYWHGHGLRGNYFEELINYANEIYKKNNLALIQKIATPIKPIELNNKNHTISLAYFEKKSTVDYIGVVQGIPICFDAKETSKKSLPLKNIHQHQIEFMDKFEIQGGIAFLLVHFLFNDTYFCMSFRELKSILDNPEYKKKSIAYKSFKNQIYVLQNNCFLNYLESINKILDLQYKS